MKIEFETRQLSDNEAKELLASLQFMVKAGLEREMLQSLKEDALNGTFTFLVDMPEFRDWLKIAPLHSEAYVGSIKSQALNYYKHG